MTVPKNRAQRRTTKKAKPEPAPEPLTREVRLTGKDGKTQTVHLQVPTSLATRFALWAAAKNRPLAYAAALALCSPPKVRGPVVYDHDVLDFGAKIVDRLVGEIGIPYNEVYAAGMIAWLHCVDGLADLNQRIETAAGN